MRQLNVGAESLYLSSATPTFFDGPTSYIQVNQRTLYFLESEAVGEVKLQCMRSSSTGNASMVVIFTGWLIDAD